MATETTNVKYNEEFILNSRGVELFTCSWIPVDQEPKALVFICHGYAMECSITMNSTARRLVKSGFGCYGIDYEGHGKSGGLQAYVPNFDDIVDDCADYFSSICEKKENKEKMRYLLGESMGGAMVLLLHRKMPDYWDGAVLAAPMCKLADAVKPPQIVVNMLTKLCRFIPTWKIIPGQDVIDIGFKQPEIRKQIRENQYCYKGRPRLKTGYELLRISMDLEKRLGEVKIPFILLHGEEDRVTDKTVSKQLFESASCSDKTLKLYEGMWHGLLYGEPLENIEVVFKDIIDWLNKRTIMDTTRLERELKHHNDDLVKQ